MSNRNALVNSIFCRFTESRLPDATHYALDTAAGRADLVAAFRTFGEASDGLVKAIVRYLATSDSPAHSKFLKKLQTHAESSRVFANEWVTLNRRGQHWRDAGVLNLIEIVQLFMGGKSRKEKWAEGEFKAMEAMSKKLEKTYYKLERERELLLVEIEATL